MALSTIIDAIVTNPEATARRADDGYFGWTDRYGLRRSFVSDYEQRRARPRPYFIANY